MSAKPLIVGYLWEMVTVWFFILALTLLFYKSNCVSDISDTSSADHSKNDVIGNVG